MPTKSIKSLTDRSSILGEYESIYLTPREANVSLTLQGEKPGPGEWIFLVLFDGQILFETKWSNEVVQFMQSLPLDLKKNSDQSILIDRPLTFLLRLAGGKGTKDPDPFLHVDNRVGGNVDLFPLLLGEEKIVVNAPLYVLTTGEVTTSSVIVHADTNGVVENSRVPIIITMLSAHCLPVVREGTVYMSAVGLNEIHNPMPIHFGMSMSTASATKVVWSSISNAAYGANTLYNIPEEDKFISDCESNDTDECISVYWNAMKRVLVDPIAFRERIENGPFMVELAGVPKQGKIDVRGRYMSFIDLGVLLQPGQYGVTTCGKLLYFNESDLPERMRPLLELPPTSAKISVRESDVVTDELNHVAYIAIRFDLFEPLVPKSKIAALYEKLGFPCPEVPAGPVEELRVEPTPEDPVIDVRKIRKEGGALAVHKELCGLSCMGTMAMNQSNKRTAANRLLYRVRSMLKQFPPGECSQTYLQDTITAQHLACRRAVTASFAPQPPLPRSTSRVAAARSRIGGDGRIMNHHIEQNLRALPKHPRPLFCKALRYLENQNENDARDCILKALSFQPRNRFLLWTLGAINYDKTGDSYDEAHAALRIAVKGDVTDGVTNAIAWASLHSFYHFHENAYAAFIAAKKMRKAYELPREWKRFLQRWVETSGEEESFWIPSLIDISNPLLTASAFFLCLRCFRFSDLLMQCFLKGCATRGSRLNLKTVITEDYYYVQAAYLLLQKQVDKAIQVTETAIKKFGPSCILSQMRLTCLVFARGWDGECEKGLSEADKAGSKLPPLMLLRAALGGIKSNPQGALQRAARAHKLAPSAYSALILSRVYLKIGMESLAERWAAAAVNTEPLLADGWAVLALLAMGERNLDKARNMIRTAKQAGPVSADVKEDVRKAMKVVRLEGLPELLVKEICFCDYY
ncbi:uncharacterized protein LOC125049904 [Pieris napi]|uniref:uncharacterized protein LOC125049904 n=1 Tax=Pieris napi TaxID=78633 RepID=UPI001FBAA867|nr:uncharacterized protein LOC125049904 [Pieris napi]